MALAFDPEAAVCGHRLIGDHTCIAWSLELLLKIHGALKMEEYPLQESAAGSNYGYGGKEVEYLASRGLHVSKFHFPERENFEQFFAGISTALDSNQASVFTVISQISYDAEATLLALSCHAFTAIKSKGEVVFVSKRHADQRVVHIPKSQLAIVCHDWDLLTEKLPQYRGHLLNGLTVV